MANLHVMEHGSQDAAPAQVAAEEDGDAGLLTPMCCFCVCHVFLSRHVVRLYWRLAMDGGVREGNLRVETRSNRKDSRSVTNTYKPQHSGVYRTAYPTPLPPLSLSFVCLFVSHHAERIS